LSSLQIEKIIRRDCGIGPLNPTHIAWLQTLIKVAFRSKSSVLIFYTENQNNYIYLFPTNDPDLKCPRKSGVISEEDFKKHKKEADLMLKSMKEKTEFFASLSPYYKIKIIRKLPLKIKNSEKFNDQASE
jgi:hypothetical protein